MLTIEGMVVVVVVGALLGTLSAIAALVSYRIGRTGGDHEASLNRFISAPTENSW